MSSDISAVFLDRDGLIIEDVHFLARPEQINLLPGAAGAISRLNQASIPVIVATNQSGIARGHFTDDDYQKVKQHLDDLLALEGARLDATYYCPHHPEHTGPCDCRKPGLGMFRRASARHGIDLSSAIFVGDRWRDIAAAWQLGAQAFIVPSSHTTPDDLARARVFALKAQSLADVVSTILGADDAKIIPWQSD